MAECFELAVRHGITTYLLWNKRKQQWFVATIIYPNVFEWFDLVKEFKVK